MFKRVSIVLAIVLVLSLASGAWMSVSAESPEVPFKAYYPVLAGTTFDLSCGCIQQKFTSGDGLASHMGVSLFIGEAKAWPGEHIIQIGDGKLFAANGDTITVHYVGTGDVIDQGQHIDVDGWYEVTGGTGRFEGVTGEGKYRVFVYNNGSQPNDLWFEGHLHNP
jgi:hypothetical protein